MAASQRSIQELMGVLSRHEILVPAVRGSRALHDPEMVGRLELQTNFAALLAVLRRLILGIGMRDLLRFAQFWLGTSARGGRAETRQEIWRLHQLAHLLVGATRWRRNVLDCKGDRSAPSVAKE